MAASLVDMDVMIDGAQLYKELRAERPIYFDQDIQMYVVSRHADIAEVFRQPNLFSNARALFHSFNFEDVVTNILDRNAHGAIERVLPMTDPPEHTRVRAMVNLAFSVRRVSKIHEYIRHLADELIDRFIDDGKVEVVAQFAIPMPVTVIGDLLCVPRGRIDDITRWTRAYSACAGNRLTSHEEAVNVGNDLAEMENFIVDHIEERRKNPGDDALSDLLTARSGSYEPLTNSEIIGIAAAFLGAGHETSTVVITSIFKILAQNPHLMESLRNASDQDAAYRAFCEEVLRLEPPVNSLLRVATEDTELAGCKIPAGSRVVVFPASANRDEAVFGSDAEEFNPSRPGVGRHMTFGGGAHLCLGNMLARAELNTVARAIVRRFDSLKLVNPNPPFSDYHAVVMPINWRLKKLEIEFTKRDPPSASG